MELSPHQLVYLLHALVVGPLLVYVGACGKKCPNAVFLLVLALGLGVIAYHSYLLVKSLKEGFIHPGGYLGRPEPFVPFSYPYNGESNRYYSLHDPEHNRGCNCQHKTDCQCGCHQGAKCDSANCGCNCHHQHQHHHENNHKEGFMVPNYGMKPVVPNM